eukprot:gene17179-22695_t
MVKKVGKYEIGRTLGEGTFGNSKRLNEEQAKFYFNQLVEGVEYCHNLGVCHRDLKPENLLLDEHGNLKISDFGLSSLYVGYDGKKADVWSIGVILYVLLAGFLPFDESTITNLFNKIKLAEFTYPSWISNEAKEVIDRMLVADPKKRISLAQLRDHAWLQSSNQPSNDYEQNTPTDIRNNIVDEVVNEQNNNVEANDEMSDDDIDDDYIGSNSSRKPRVLNAFDLIVKSGGFRIDRMFRPDIFLSINESSQSTRLKRIDSSANPGILKFGSSIIKSSNAYKFTSSVSPPEDLMKLVYDNCISIGFTFPTPLENILTSGKAKGHLITGKG